MHGILTLLEQLTNPKTPSHFDPYGRGYSHGTPHKTYNCYKYTSKNRFVRQIQSDYTIQHPTLTWHQNSHMTGQTAKMTLYTFTHKLTFCETQFLQMVAKHHQISSSIMLTPSVTGRVRHRCGKSLNKHCSISVTLNSKAQSPKHNLRTVFTQTAEDPPKMVDSIQIRRVWG